MSINLDLNTIKNIDKLKKILKNKKIIIYGTGSVYVELKKSLDLISCIVVGIIDSKFENSNEEYFDSYKILNFDDIFKIDSDYILVTPSNPVSIVENIVYRAPFFSKTKIISVVSYSILELYSRLSFFEFIFYVFHQLFNIKFLLKIYMRISNFKDKIKFFYLKRKNNIKKILLIEPNECHYETIPSVVKYFYDLGYSVDVVLNKKIKSYIPLKDFFEFNRSNYFFDYDFIVNNFNNNIFNRYKYIFFNSYNIYKSSKLPNITDLFDLSCINVPIFSYIHHIEKFDNNKKIIPLILPNFQSNDNYPMLNPNYFCKIKKHSKNKITKFVVVGNLDSNRKNFQLLIDSVVELSTKTSMFKILLIGKCSNIDIPNNIRKYFKRFGCVSFSKMYHEISNADFILPLFDIDNLVHHRYLNIGTSGTIQLSLGFLKPMIIQKDFSKAHGFSGNNVINYNNNSQLSDTLNYAININNQIYCNLVESLDEYRQYLYNISLSNLKDKVNII